jgi:hypothetical protein
MMPIVNAAQLMKMTKQLLDRLDATTAYMIELMGEPDRMDVKELGQEIESNLTVLDQFRAKEQKQ